MDEDRDLVDDFDCPSLLCEEQEDLDNRENDHADINLGGGDKEAVSEREDEQGGEETEREEGEISEKGSGASGKELFEMGGRQEEREGGLEGGAEAVEMDTEIENDEETVSDKQADKDTSSLEEKDGQKQRRRSRGKKQIEPIKNKKGQKGVSARAEGGKKMQEMPEVISEAGFALPDPSVEIVNSCDLSGSTYLRCGAGLYCPSAPIPLLYSMQPEAQFQPALPQPHGTKRPHSPLLSHSLPQPAPQPLEMEITQVYSTRRSIRYSTRGRGRTLAFPLLSGLDMGEPVDPSLLPPPPKKKTRTLYTTDQLEHLEGLFQEDHYPDAEKRKVIATSVGVTPQRIMVWFQNRRAKWRKVERSTTGKVENKPSRVICSSSLPQQTNPSLATRVPLPNKGGSLSGHSGPIAPPLPAAPAFPIPSTQTLPSYSALLASLTSPSQSGTRDGYQHQPSSQGGSTAYHPPPMHSPPPLRRASLPVFATTFNPNPTPPLLNTPAHTPPLFLEALEGTSSLAHHDPPGRDPQSLQGETSCQFDYGEKLDYLSSSQQNNTLSYQLQTSYPPSQLQLQPQLQPQPSCPRLAYLTPSPYLTPNPPDSNSTSYLTFGPGGGSTGVVTYATGGHAYFQSQSAGQILLQSTGHHAGTTAYQSYPWGNMFSQPTVFQRGQCPPTYSASMGAPQDHQQHTTTTTTLHQPSYFPRGSHGPLHSQRPSHTQTHTVASTTAALPAMSMLRPSCLRAESGPTKVPALAPSQISPASPESPPAPSCVKIEYDSPREIHSHFHCDFSPIHF